MDSNNVLFNKDDGVAIITINRPKSLNALNYETLKELDSALDKAEDDKDVKVVIITGSGEKAFVAGADIAEMRNMTPLEAKKFSEYGQSVFRKIETLSKPVIAAVNGFALGGGCELSMACDIRIASKNAKFGQPEVGLGIIPGFSGTQRLPRIIGTSKAKELIFTGEMINSDEAYRIGLISKIVELSDLIEESKKLAKTMMSKSQIAISLAKEAINKGMETDLDTGNTIEAEKFSLCFTTDDQKEGMIAFSEKRAPKFGK
ncbi:crotonase [Thermoanaerobacterium thermosaccharolyticum]|uniref:short-chain-enoyl-CoA hydratase n=1 Tax=Thermoanaerobacterium thermosaccharolyticum TaxID=1517 RepID=A0A223I229_THETR|nr:short-chain-enoyl-CoA hydratase [Thermoanaerobacterium thermosaccharolyticum]AST58760.1 crotonase [Thermoanaerobacterium thermosaccharolyticum]PHO06801.1 crotonase [Thermoanaerobacterium thermosaccharolyticum]